MWWRPLNQRKRSLFLEAGGGLMLFAEIYPKSADRDTRLGTHLNSTTRYGIGGEINLNSGVAAVPGLRHIHVSKGATSGVERNPSHDSNGFLPGISFVPGR